MTIGDADPSYPNLFLIGAPKAGTTALADSLARHPSIFCRQKEPRFFDSHVVFDDPELYPINNVSEYLSYYDGEDARNALYRMDASVFNMYSLKSVNNIIEMNSDAKFLLILRDPLTASKSMFMQRLKYVRKEKREISDDFCECWNLLAERASGMGFPKGCKTSILFRYDALYHYERVVPAIVGAVGRENILVLRYEDYRDAPSAFLEFVMRWLGVRPHRNMNPETFVNPSKAVSAGVWNHLLELVASTSRPARKVLGLSGRKMRSVKELLGAAKRKEDVVIGSECDDLVIAEFKETYRFLERAENDGLISRVPGCRY